MKIDNEVLVGLGVIAVVAYIYRDKIFSKKETTTKKEPSNGGMIVMPAITNQKAVNTQNLGINSIKLNPSDNKVGYTPSQFNIELSQKNCPKGMFC